jgi:hypothetical protein
LPEKLAKYVPAETLAFFVPVSAGIGGGHDSTIALLIFVAAAGTVGYLWLNGRKLPRDERPLVHFYVLAVLAFLCWALGTSSAVASLVGADEVTSGVVLAIAVFAIPLLDGVITELRLNR